MDAYSATEPSCSSSHTPTRWCGAAASSAAVGWLVNTGSPRYSCIASHETISPPVWAASASAAPLLPEAVGPNRATTRGVMSGWRWHGGDTAAERLRRRALDQDVHQVAGRGGA